MACFDVDCIMGAVSGRCHNRLLHLNCHLATWVLCRAKPTVESFHAGVHELQGAVQAGEPFLLKMGA